MFIDDGFRMIKYKKRLGGVRENPKAIVPLRENPYTLHACAPVLFGCEVSSHCVQRVPFECPLVDTPGVSEHERQPHFVRSCVELPNCGVHVQYCFHSRETATDGIVAQQVTDYRQQAYRLQL